MNSRKLQTKKKLRLPNGAVGKDITTKIPVVDSNMTIGEIRNKLSEFTQNTDSVDYIYVNNINSQLAGVISIKELFQNDPAKKVKDIMITDLVVSHPKINKGKVAHMAIKHNIKAVPIVDTTNHLVGVLTNDKVLAILYNQYRNSFHHFAGVVSIGDKYQTILDYGIFKNIISRLPWILVGLIGGIFSAQVIGFFEHTLSANVVLAIFIPLVVYIGNAVGAQTQTFLVRDLAFSPKLTILPYFAKQLVSSTCIGLICGTLIWLVIATFWKLSFIGIVVGLASFVAISVSTIVAVLIPYLLFKLNQEPASGSGPFATILQDLLSVSIYFGVASVFL
ncbi:magnesium transporter [Candidatus Woesebacteria bacterium]|nr:MAG: magnesium transporter [Candidatus Woesebacteria bacterium]